MKIRSVNHYNFTVQDLNKSIEFYTKILRLKLSDSSTRDPEFAQKAIGESGISIRIAYLIGNGFKLELIEYKKPEKVFLRSGDEITYGHLCLNVLGLRRFYENYKDKINFESEPLRIPSGPNKNGYMVYFYDPDRNKIELIERNAND
jgi:catechol 2,3-dioxygenase-like lactoylglutathione lyase family enzyme